jgi:hypothetical protein
LTPRPLSRPARDASKEGARGGEHSLCKCHGEPLPIDLLAIFDQSARVKIILMLVTLAAVAIASSPNPRKEFKLYAEFLEDTPVELSDGAKWMMDKGDVFPVMMYKEMQKKIVLQLAGATFMTETQRVRILDEYEVPAGLVRYRKNVETYLRGKSDKWKQEAKR